MVELVIRLIIRLGSVNVGLVIRLGSVNVG